MRTVKTAAGARARARRYYRIAREQIALARAYKAAPLRDTDLTLQLIRDHVTMARSYARSARYYRNHAKYLTRHA